MKTLLTVIITLCLATPARADDTWVNVGLVVAANTADAWTTIGAFRRGGREKNPFSRGWPLPAIVANKAVFTFGLGGLVWLLERNGHQRIARVMTYVDVAGMVGVGRHNAGVGR